MVAYVRTEKQQGKINSLINKIENDEFRLISGRYFSKGKEKQPDTSCCCAVGAIVVEMGCVKPFWENNDLGVEDIFAIEDRSLEEKLEEEYGLTIGELETLQYINDISHDKDRKREVIQYLIELRDEVKS